MNKIIEIKNLAFGYDKKPIFSQVNLEIYKGDFIGIFGENGTGKTTLVKLLLSILKPNSGEINWFDIEGMKTSQSKFNIEYISQKAQMIDSIIPITVEEIVKMGNKPKGGIMTHFTANCSYETIEKALSHVHMNDFIHAKFSQLSGGQKQRVLIAKALISNPDIIIMDEATAGIDLVAQKHFYDLLSHLNQVHNITIIVISHDTKFIGEKIKRLWYVGNSNCDECGDSKMHLKNIKNMFPLQKVEFLD